MSRHYPDTLNVRVNLTTGDSLPATAYRSGRDENGLVRYVVRLEDGGPLEIRREQVTGMELDMLPGRSTVEVLFWEG